MQKTISTLILISAFALSAVANGGPDDGSNIYGSGDPHFMLVKNVELVSEKLDIKVDCNHTDVHVTYRLHNQSSKPTGKIHYGFPVEYTYSDYTDSIWSNDNMQQLEFRLDRKALPVKSSDANPNAAYFKAHEENEEFYGEETEEGYTPRLWRKWFYTEFSIPANGMITLEVSYRIANNFEDWSTSKSSFPGFGERSLHYTFSPAAYWGKGIVKDFQVNIESADKIKASGLDFKQEGNYFTYSVADFDLKTAKPLSISTVNIENRLMSQYINTSERDKKLVKSINASSTLKDFSVNSLTDNDFSTAWVEGKPGSGIGEYIDITLDKKAIIYGVILVNGYTKSEKTYLNNNRIKKIKLELMYDPKSESSYGKESPIEIELPDVPYQSIDISNFFTLSSIIFDGGDGGRSSIDKIRITIMDVYKGSKYDDTCISEILVLGKFADSLEY